MPQGTLPVLPVADVEAALAHYVDDLGFAEVMRVPGQDGALESGLVARGACQIMFNRNPADADRSGGGIWLWIRVDDEDIDFLYEKLSGQGISIRETIGDRFWGDRSFAIEDRLGYTLAFNKRLEQAG